MITCGSDARRAAVRDDPVINGIDYLEVRTLERADHTYPNPLLIIHCFKQASLSKDNILITGGTRIKNVVAEWAYGAEDLKVNHPELLSTEELLVLDGLEQPENVIVARASSRGDFSIYKLKVVKSVSNPTVPADNFDSILSEVEFSFKIECPSDFDCACKKVDQQEFDEPSLDYMAKDYSSFRKLVLDRLSLIMPDWKERNPADVGIMLVELLAYVGDHLSYYQDAVATEAYLGTARRRVSAARHARLLDYYVDEGCNARAWVCFKTRADGVKIKKGEVLFTGDGSQATDCLLRKDWIPLVVPETGQDKIARIEEEIARGSEVFETMHEINLYKNKHNMSFYAWGERDCWLPAGATTATLVNTIANLKAFTWEDVGTNNKELFAFLKDTFAIGWLDMGEVTKQADEIKIMHGNESTAIELKNDEAKLYINNKQAYEFDVEKVASKHVIKSSSLRVGDVLVFEEVLSPSEGSPPDPSHRHAVRLTSVNTLTDELKKVSIIRISWGIEDALPFPLCLAKDGQEISVARGNIVLVDHGYTITESLELAVASGRYYPRLARKPVTNAGPNPGTQGSARSAFTYKPSEVKPAISLTRMDDSRPPWKPQRDLISSDEFAPEFVVETERDGTSYIRFGNADRKDWGRQLEKHGSFRPFMATYRIGNGTKGNVGACSISRILDETGGYSDITGITNPMPALGGRDPETLESIRQHAPQAFRRQERAVTEEDYTEVLKRHPQVQHAVAVKRWTGSWYTMFVTVDRLGELEFDSQFEDDIVAFLEKYRLAGYDLEINPPVYVPVRISLDICIKTGYFEGEVKERLMWAFSNHINPDGSRGFFHPDNFTFGQPLYLSRVYEAAMSVEGVSSVEVKVFQRWAKTESGELDAGVISVGNTEIIRLDNDPSKAENGMIEFKFCGGIK
ncbi:MAG TPA: baseplate J/gp47 family protein [Nitrososphaera sp.]